ncbi:MAG: hypothetical protein NXI32_28335 [bacterium]|nr:hypothetical protein [bacterium]
MPAKASSEFVVSGILCLSLVFTGLPCAEASALDYFLVLAGGHSPAGNQASLEANVLFFREVLREQHHAPWSMTTYFADGQDEKADLQYSVEIAQAASPATNLLTNLVSFGGPSNTRLRYRNHRVENTAGPLRPELVRSELHRLSGVMRAGDRLLIYVTSHGGKAEDDDPYNTTISCWDRQSITARDFESWLDGIPEEVPVIMVMAQCYCGGFAHTIFDNSRQSDGISPHNRVGFFAQQHDLAAAGCRPDIRNDEEYSSYFWGAIAGRTRSGKPVERIDLDADGKVSFVEAHTYAVLASQTIDIPLRTSETLLRTYSRIGNYDYGPPPGSGQQHEFYAASTTAKAASEDSTAADQRVQDSGQEQYAVRKPAMLAEISGSLADMAARGSRDQSAIVHGLARQLDLDMSSDATTVLGQLAEEIKDASGSSSYRRGSRGRRSMRSNILKQIAEEFPELADRENWKEAESLRPENQQATYERLIAMEAFERYQEALDARQQADQQRRTREMRKVKLQRLTNTLEAIVLAENLALLAPPDIVQRYETILELENSTLN